jgi:hypothetical protein
MGKRDTPNYPTTFQQPQLNMGYSKRSSSQEHEKAIQDALKLFKDGQFKLLQSAALHCGVAISTLNHRHHGRQTQIESHQPRQTLSNAEENTLLRWIIQQASIGFPVTPALVRETAQEIINQHYSMMLKKRRYSTTYNRPRMAV